MPFKPLYNNDGAQTAQLNNEQKSALSALKEAIRTKKLILEKNTLKSFKMLIQF